LRKFTEVEFLRFIVIGGVNTVLSYGIYVATNLIVPYIAAYTISMIAGILISYILNARFVYRTSLSLSRAVAYPLVYLVQYLVGVGTLYLLVQMLGVSKYLAPFLVVIVTIPITFVLSRFIIKGRTASQPVEDQS
jgi:putative flippase GtrA